jgi:DNA-binding NarL/FixJ family response regulator
MSGKKGIGYMVTVMVVDDIIPIAKKYTHFLKQVENFKVVATVHSGYEAVMNCAIYKPDIILMDVEMETRTAGLDATKHILEKFPNTKIIILTVYEDDETVFKAFQLGVTDYILKNSSSNEMITCINDAYNNRSPIRPTIAQKIRREFQRVKKSEGSFLYCLHLVTQLTQTELDILDLMSQGYSRKQICEIRCVELSTIKTQISNILKKFDCSSMEEVISQVNELNIFEYIRNLRNQNDF